MSIYLDTSAAAKLLVEEVESDSLARHLDESGDEIVACLLLETELRRFAARHAIAQGEASAVLDSVSLYDMPRSLYYEAGILSQELRSLDALHLTAAVRLGVDAVLTYDRRMRDAAEVVGLSVPVIT